MSRLGEPRPADVLIVGAGFGGLITALRLLKAGITDITILERAQEVGGTWRDNVYPGCACDVPSDLYCLASEPNPDWSASYASQAEILAYLQRTAERHDLLSRIRFGFDVAELRYDTDAALWRATASSGAQQSARVAVVAPGPLSRPKLPDIEGLETFRGRLLHSARWDTSADLSGLRVGLIGSGASAVQILPALAPQVAQLTLFQRSAPWILPRGDRAYGPVWRALRRQVPALPRLSRQRWYFLRELFGLSLLGAPWLHAAMTAIATRKRERELRDPELRQKMTPTYQLGCKRVLISDSFYPALNRSNVTVVTEPIRRALPDGVETGDGSRHALDALICATGFHAADADGFLNIIGPTGRTLTEVWAETGMQAYRGCTVAGFPNLALVLGPNTIQGHTSVLLTIEYQAAYIVNYVRQVLAAPGRSLDVRPGVQEAYNAAVRAQLSHTVWASGCGSWYLDRIGRNTTIFPGLSRRFRKVAERFVLVDYSWFESRGD